MRRVRHVRAARDEHIVVHRDRDPSDFGSGCLFILLLLVIFWLLSEPAILVIVFLGSVTFGIAYWRGKYDLGFHESERRYSVSIGLAFLAAGIGTYLLHDNIVDWATMNTTKTTGSLWWKKTYTKTSFEPIRSKIYHIATFLMIWGNGYAIISVIHELITTAQKKRG